MVLSVQEARNLTLKTGLMYQEKTRNENYRRYGGGDNKQITSERGKQSQGVQPTNQPSTNNNGSIKAPGIGNNRGNNTYPPKKNNNNPYAKPSPSKVFDVMNLGIDLMSVPRESQSML